MGHTKYRLGLDIGTNSIGWAAIRLDGNNKACGVLDMGVRIFPDGRNAKDKTSLATARRIARGQRVRRDRYLRRRSKLMRELAAYSLMPLDKDEAADILQRFDPYTLRAKALDEPLHPHELGRVLFHLNQRRGFKSNRKTQKEGDSEQKQIGAKIVALRESIAATGARTLGEFLARRHVKGQTVRARPDLELYPERRLYEDEFDAIRMAQAPHHDLDPDQWDKLKDIIFYQRPLKPVAPGWCLLESGERRAARALPSSQEFRLLQELNNLRLQVGSRQRYLNAGERERALQRLRSGRLINLNRPTRDLEFPDHAEFNLARGGRATIQGDETAARLAKEALFGRTWLSLSRERQDEIVGFLLETEDPEVVRHKAVVEWGLSAEQAATIAQVTLPSGYANLSAKAICQLLPHLMEGLGYAYAVRAAGYPHHSDFRNPRAHDKLPYYGVVLERDVSGGDPTATDRDEVTRYGRIANPTVHIGLNQLRRVVNRLIDVYGKPREMVVELARDLKANQEQRNRYQKQQAEGFKRNQRYREMLESAGMDDSPDMRLKLRLWEEQGSPARICPYTGRTLSCEMVLSNETEVDHILPFSRTLDDTIANKVVCMAQANRDKGNRTPYEAFGNAEYDKILQRISQFPFSKRWRFHEEAMERFADENDFLNRQLNETRYLSRTARTYLAHLYNEREEGQRVRAIPGYLTAILRRGWGLQKLLSAPTEDRPGAKQRNDHRHHAIDAFVVANTTQGLLKGFAQVSAHSSGRDAEKRLAALIPEPWPGFHRNQLMPLLDRMVVSYRPDHGTRGGQRQTTGQLHKETAYGLVEAAGNGTSQVVVRKPLGSLKEKDLERIRDSALRKALQELWNANKMAGGKPADFAHKAQTDGVLLNGRRQFVRRVRMMDKQRVIAIRDQRGKPFKGYIPGGNEFADVWRLRDGTWELIVVPTFEANQPTFDIERYRPRDKSGRTDPAAKRLMRLHIDDMGALGEGHERRIVRVRKITNARDRVTVVLDDHFEANVAERISKKDDYLKESKFSARQLCSKGFRKVGVDEIGRVLDQGPWC